MSGLLGLATFAAAPAAAATAAGAPELGQHEDWRHRGRDRRDDRWDRRDHRHDRRDWRNDRRDWRDGRHDRYDRHDRHDRWDGRWDRRDRWRHDDRWRNERHHDRGFRVPAHIHSFRDFERYEYGRVFDRGHGHYHRVLAFPDPLGVGYRPYVYCGDALFGSGSFFYDGPRLSIRWRF